MSGHRRGGTLCRAALRLMRLYTRYCPWRRGKYRLLTVARRRARCLPREVVASSTDGRRLLVDPTDQGADIIYFLGEYERVVTSVLGRTVRPGDVCLDVGANLGWHTTWLRSLCGDDGEVHAFEPVPETFDRLSRNVALYGSPPNVFVNRLALADSAGTTDVHVFEGIPDGHASVSPLGFAAYRSTSAPRTTLDDYLLEGGVEEVSFVKLDVEGSELAVLRGGESLFRQAVPPAFVIEMAAATSRYFGYGPNDLIDFLRRRAGFRFLAIDEASGALVEIERFPRDSPGAYVLCLPVGGRVRVEESVAGAASSWRDIAREDGSGGAARFHERGERGRR